MVSAKEVRAITTGKEGVQVRGEVPYIEICKDPCMHAVLLLAIGGLAAFYIFTYFGPTFMNKVMGVHVANTGFLTALPQALGIALKFILGPIFDISTFISERTRLLIFAFLTQGVTAFCLFVISQNPCKVLTQVAYCAACAFNGSNLVAAMKCAQIVARQHMHFVLVCVTIGGCAAAFVVPAIVAIVCPHNTIEEWSTLFLGTSVFLVMSTIPYTFLATNEPAPWTKATLSSTSNISRTSHSRNVVAKSRAAIFPSDSTKTEHNRDANVDVA
uniref:MFS domain-containing protein n=1 Tax=Angiostrongylus cantonensis TaxID=6313 RepID=A0A158PCI1_ANGCA